MNPLFAFCIFIFSTFLIICQGAPFFLQPPQKSIVKLENKNVSVDTLKVKPIIKLTSDNGLFWHDEEITIIDLEELLLRQPYQHVTINISENAEPTSVMTILVLIKDLNIKNVDLNYF